MEEKSEINGYFLKNPLCIKVTCWRVKYQMFKKGKNYFEQSLEAVDQKKKKTTQNPLGKKPNCWAQ